MQTSNPFRAAPWVALVPLALALVLPAAPAEAGFLSRWFHRDEPRVGGALGAALSKIQREISTCNADVAALREEVSGVGASVGQVGEAVQTLGEELIPCTPQRFLEGSCGENQHPFNLVVTLCGGIGAQAQVGASFSVENHTSLELGAGWDEVAHVNLDRQIQFPGIPGLELVSPLLGFPFPDLQAGASGTGGLELTGCIEGVTIPIGGNIPREQVLALIAQLEQGASLLQTAAVNAIQERGLTTSRVVDTLGALQQLQDDVRSPSERGLTDPLQIFQEGPLNEVAAALPVGPRIQSLMDDPSQIIPPMEPGAAETVAAVQQLCARDLSDRPTLAKALTPTCDLLGRTPSFEQLSTSLGLIQELPDEIVFGVSQLLPDLNPGLPEPPKPRPSADPICVVLPILPRCN